jgi:hypothetical protein
VGHADYIHFNPVKHGHVKHVKYWPHSSLHRMVRLGIYPIDWAGDATEGAPSFVFDIMMSMMGVSSYFVRLRG